MKLFSRLFNLIRGFFSIFLGRAERNNPEIAYENAVNALTTKYVAFKKAASSILRRRENIEARLIKEREQLQLVSADLEKAVEQDDDDVAIALIQKKESIEGEVADLESDLADAQKDADEAKGSLTAIKAEIVRLKDERDRVVAKMKSAQAKISIQEQLEGISVDAELKALGEARENAQNLLTEAKLNDELNEDSLETKLQVIRARGSKENATKKLQELKAKKQKALPPASEKGKVIDASFDDKVPAGGKEM